MATYNSLMPVMAMTPGALGLHYGFGVDAKGFAIFAAPAGAAGVAGGLLVGLAITKVQPRVMMILGLLLLAASCVLTGYFHDGKAALIVFALLFGLGMGMTSAAAPNLVIASVPPELQATTSSMVAVFQSGVAAVLPVIAFSVLNSHIGIMLRGNVFYTDAGIRYGFLIGGGTALAGAIVALAIPRRIQQLHAPADIASPGIADGSGEAVAAA
jgi:MFS family permease